MPNLNLEDILVDNISEDNLIEVPHSPLVFKVFIALASLVFLILLGQIINIGVLNNDVYSRLAMANSTKVVSEAAPRGLILDRFGEVIVGNTQIFRAYLSPNDLPQGESDRMLAFQDISDALNIDINDLIKTVESHDWRTGKLVLDDNLSHENMVRIRSLDTPGLFIESAYRRSHSTALAFSHVAGYVGFVTHDDLLSNSYLRPDSEVGKVGLEKVYDETLRGLRGQEVSFVSATGRQIEERRITESTPGKNLETFIDKGLQEKLFASLSSQINNLGSLGGSGLVMNPKTGEVLAMVSLPSFDINNISNYLTVTNSPFLNRNISGRYSPGSVIKPLVALASLEEGVVDPSDRFYSSGRLVVENPHYPSQPSIFHDWAAHGWVDLYSGLARSSNVYYYIVGGGYEDKSGLGISRLNKWWKQFRLGELSGIDLPGEREGLLPDPNWKQAMVNDIWRLGDTYNVSIGQGDLELTPIALLNYINAIANKGVAYNPRIAKDVKKDIIIDLRDLVSTNNFEAVHKGMVDTVTQSYGTAHTLNSLPFSFAGKTGSAQFTGGSTNAFFVGYGPEEDPEVSILVFIEGARDGSLNTVPVVHDVMLWYYENRLNGDNT